MRILKISAFAIASVVIVEVIFGFVTGSLAILSDGAHALLDTLSMFVLLFATSASLKPPDEEHMYGHEKIESIGGLIGGIILLATAIFLTTESVLKLMANEPYLIQEWEFAGFIAIAYTFCIDILRVRILHKSEGKSITMKAGLYHALADLGSTLIAFFGFGLATLGFYQGDASASLVLSAIMNYLSVNLIWSSGMELSDAISKDIVKKIQSEIASVKSACLCENLKVRKSGEKIFVEATFRVPDYISLEEAHEITVRIEENMKKNLGNVETTFHIEPAGTQEMPTKKLIEQLATEVEGVREAHEINAIYTKNRLYITLHARVDPKLSVQAAHKIAEEIETKIDEKISNIENLTVHIEPFRTKIEKGSAVNEETIKKIIYNIAESFAPDFRIKRVVTYVADKKLYINMDCCFTKQISIEDAHKIASQIEYEINKQFAETIVTVHTEPSSA
ncbi:MAG: cation-efflux pump [Candidatus Bathyarchaeota archaeon]|nr:cation-efflux pump [Candidatus Bathyarchaeota archaeon]